jgi:hypothetical protein
MINMGDDAEISNVRCVHSLAAGSVSPEHGSTLEHGKLSVGSKFTMNRRIATDCAPFQCDQPPLALFNMRQKI